MALSMGGSGGGGGLGGGRKRGRDEDDDDDRGDKRWHRVNEKFYEWRRHFKLQFEKEVEEAKKLARKNFKEAMASARIRIANQLRQCGIRARVEPSRDPEIRALVERGEGLHRAASRNPDYINDTMHRDPRLRTRPGESANNPAYNISANNPAYNISANDSGRSINYNESNSYSDGAYNHGASNINPNAHSSNSSESNSYGAYNNDNAYGYGANNIDLNTRSSDSNVANIARRIYSHGPANNVAFLDEADQAANYNMGQANVGPNDINQDPAFNNNMGNNQGNYQPDNNQGNYQPINQAPNNNAGNNQGDNQAVNQAPDLIAITPAPSTITLVLEVEGAHVWRVFTTYNEVHEAMAAHNLAPVNGWYGVPRLSVYAILAMTDVGYNTNAMAIMVARTTWAADGSEIWVRRGRRAG